MANGNIFSGLNDLPVFEGRTDEDTRRALLASGLALMQPVNPLTGGGALGQLGGGIQAGLDSLDTTERKNTALTQQDFLNSIATRGAVTDERRTTVDEAGVPIDQQQADTQKAAEEAAAATAKGNLEEEIRQFNRGGLDRAAERALKSSKAKYYDRLPEAGIAGRATSASNIQAQHIAKMNSLWEIDQAKSPLEQQFDGKDDPLLIDSAWRDVVVREGLAGSEALGIIATGGDDAAAIGANVAAAADPGLSGLRGIPSPEERLKAEEAMGWTAEQWREAVRSNDPLADRLLQLFPGLLRKAKSELSQ